MKSKAARFEGPFLQVLENLKVAFNSHVDHRICLSVDIDDPDFSAVFCRDCDREIVMGSRELIELVYLDAVNGPPLSH